MLFLKYISFRSNHPPPPRTPKSITKLKLLILVKHYMIFKIILFLKMEQKYSLQMVAAANQILIGVI